MSLKDICNFSTKQTELYDTPFGHHEHDLFDKLSSSHELEDKYFEDDQDSVEKFSTKNNEFENRHIDESLSFESEVIAPEDFKKGTFTHAIKSNEKREENAKQQIKLSKSTVDSLSMDELLVIVRQEIEDRGIDVVVEECAYHSFLGGKFHDPKTLFNNNFYSFERIQA